MQNTSVLRREVKAEYIRKDFLHCDKTVKEYAVGQLVEEDHRFDSGWYH